MAPHETRPDSHVDAPEEPRDPCRPWSRNLSLRPHLQMRTSAPAATAEEFRGAPGDSHGDWASLRLHKWIPAVPVLTREEPCRNL